VPIREILARGVALASLVLLLWRVLQPEPAAEAEVVSGANLPAALSRWSVTSFPRAVHAAFTSLPTRVDRDWLKAAGQLGTRVSWSGETGAPALEISATREPVSSFVIHVVADGSRTGTLRDEWREIAVVSDGARLSVVRTPVAAGRVQLGEVGRGPSAPVPIAPRVRRVALVGPASWETKFAIAALEEAGWSVDSRVTVAPGVGVGGLAVGALDTARYSAIVAIEAVPDEWAPAVMRFVSTGGGLVLSGGAVAARSVGQILPGAVGSVLDPHDAAIVDRDALTGRALTPAPGAVAMESRGDVPVVVARRAGPGRVIAVGYRDTWRWRMQGGNDSPGDHRGWWSAVVAAAAYAPDTVAFAAPESAPRAALVAALGAPVAESARRPRSDFPHDAVLLTLASVALLVEIVSRRRRGLR
jgi:hypothetical protein